MSGNRETSAVLQKHLTIVVGYYGCGKTEFAVNAALTLAREGHPTALADLDVVNPYFRSREKQDLLEKMGISLIANTRSCADADVPSMPPEMNLLLQSDDIYGVIDAGGGTSGAKILKRYKEKIFQRDYQMLFVLNANRPMVSKEEDAVRYLQKIQRFSGIPVSGIVNNTHMCGETGREDIYRGIHLAEKVSRRLRIPVLYHVMEEKFAEVKVPQGEKFLIKIQMHKPWEMEKAI